MTERKGESWLLFEGKAAADRERARQLLELSAPFLRSLGRLSLACYGPNVPVIYSELRRGEGGKEFACAKSRTIPPGMLAKDVPALFGAIRASGLDEIIQTVHVLDGTMLFSGRPRPLVQHGIEATHESVDTMKKYLPRSIFAEWLRIYDLAPPGFISSYGNISKTLPHDIEIHCQKRAELDIMDAHEASPEHDLRIIEGAVAYLDLLQK